MVCPTGLVMIPVHTELKLRLPLSHEVDVLIPLEVGLLHVLPR